MLEAGKMVKAIAVDKDGTLMRSDHTLDELYFEQLFQTMMKQDIKFIVASGNQYAQLKSLFPDKVNDITFVAENGAVTYYQDEILDANYFDKTVLQQILGDIIDKHKVTDLILSGVRTAYVLPNVTEDFTAYFNHYYYDVQQVKHFDDISDDDFVKVAMRIKDTTVLEQVKADLEAQYPQYLRAVTSGNDSLDLILPDVNKGVAIQSLLARWGIDEEDLLAFGDADNDIEMLSLTPHSYAMAECSESLASVANHRAPSNNDSGVLKVIEHFITS